MKYFLKYIPICAVLAVVFSFVFSVHAIASSEDYNDYIPDEGRGDNLIADNTNLNLYRAVNTRVVQIDPGEDSSEVNYIYIGDGSGNGKWDNFSYYGTEGTWAKSTGGGAGQTSGFNGYYPNGPENYVVEFQIRNAAPEINPNPAFTFSVFTSRLEGITDKQIVPVTETDNFQTVKTVFNTEQEAPSSLWMALGYGGASSKDYPITGTTVALYKPSLYVAVEKPHDIIVEPQESISSFIPGQSFVLDAYVVNQIGIIGNLRQNFEWFALNADKTEILSDIILDVSDDTASATVTLGKDTEPGTYCVTARSKDYPQMVRTFCVSVGVMEDYIPGEKPDASEGEAAFNILSEQSGDAVAFGEKLTAGASVVNQQNLEGNLNQHFEWTLLDKYRAPYRGDYSLEVSEDTCEAVFAPGASLPSGVYYIAATSAEYNMTRLIGLRVVMEGISFYVSPEGTDRGDGTLSSPFATVEKARQEVSKIKNKDDYRFIEVVLRGGEYFFGETLFMDGDDSGTEKTPVVYRAYEGEKPVIKGSVPLNSLQFGEVLDPETVARLHPDAVGKVFYINLADEGIAKEDIFDFSRHIATLYSLSETYEFNAIFADGVSQTLSQWPNGREYSQRGDAIVDYTYKDENDKDVKVSTSFYYTQSEPDRWEKAKNWYIGAFIPYDYSYARLSVESVDTDNNILKVHAPENTKNFNFTNNFSRRWKAFNLLEEIDVPGEYCIDSENMILYYYPAVDMDSIRMEIAVMTDDLLWVNGAQNILFEGITFAQTNGRAVRMTDVVNVDIDGCTFESVGGRAIHVTGSQKAETNPDHWQRQAKNGSYNTDITNCDFFNLANSAISMTGGDVDTLTPSGNVIENNIINGFSLNTLSSSDGAIALDGCGITVRNNNISGSPGIAVKINGNDHRVEYNEIYDVMREVQDAGAIYQGQNSIARGSVIACNYIHDMRPLDSSLNQSAQVGIYLDDCQQDLTVKNNIIKNVKIDFNSNGAGAFTFSGNTSVDVDKSWNLLNHNLTTGYTVTAGYEGSLDFIKGQLYDRELYYGRYPELKEFIENGKNPKRNTVVTDNLTVNAGKTNIESQDILYAKISGNDSVEDSAYSLFVNPEKQDYRIRTSSEYCSEARVTEAFDIEKIGTDGKRTFSVSPFRLIYPQDGARTAKTSEGIRFIWDNAFGANDYIVTVATDADMKNTVFTQRVRTNSCAANLTETGKTYYWTVTAVNTSRDFLKNSDRVSPVKRFVLEDFADDVTFGATSAVVTDTSLKIKSVITNNAVWDNADFTVYFTAYGNNCAVEVQKYKVNISPGQTADIYHEFTAENPGDIEYIKIFVWTGNSLIPACKARVINR